MNIFASIVYINRYVNLPASITLSEDQKLQYEDIKFIVSPYTIAKQDSTYKFAKIMYFDFDLVKAIKDKKEVQVKSYLPSQSLNLLP